MAVDSRTTAKAANATGRRAVRRRVGAAAALAALLALVACDLSVSGMRSWWDRHAFTSCVVSSLLVVAVTVLVVDEIIARRQRNERAVSVAVQSLIVYTQAVHGGDAVETGLREAAGGAVDATAVDTARAEVRSLASMILVASPALFDDPEARQFLEEVQRLAATMYTALAVMAATDPTVRATGAQLLDRLGAYRAQIKARIAVLATRLPARDRAPLEELDDVSGPKTPSGQAAARKS